MYGLDTILHTLYLGPGLFDKRSIVDAPRNWNYISLVTSEIPYLKDINKYTTNDDLLYMMSDMDKLHIWAKNRVLKSISRS